MLIKYKKKARDIAEEKALREKEHKARVAKEKQRLMGRRIPTKSDNDKERALQIVATKGVI